MGLSIGALELARLAPDNAAVMAEIESQFAAAARQLEADTAQDYAIYGSGTFATITAERLNDFLELLITIGWFIVPSVLAMFLLGVRAGKRGWFDVASEQHKTFPRLLWWALPLGLVMNGYIALTGFEQNRLGAEVLTWQTFLQVAALNIGSVLLSQSYVALLTRFSGTATGERLLAPLAAVGRMALTNYLTHSLVMTTLAYGYGFGLFGQVGLAAGLGLAIVLYALQIPLSNWWMARYRFGPVEWLWRTLTHGRAQPMVARAETAQFS